MTIPKILIKKKKQYQNYRSLKIKITNKKNDFLIEKRSLTGQKKKFARSSRNRSPVNGWWKRRNKKRGRNEEGTGTQRNEFEALRWDDVINLIYTRACFKRTRTVPLFGAHLGWSGRGCGRKYVDTHARTHVRACG